MPQRLRRRNRWVERAQRRTGPLLVAGGLLAAVGLAVGPPHPWLPWCTGAATTVLIAMGALATTTRRRWPHVFGALAWVCALYALQIGLMGSLIHAGAMASPPAGGALGRNVLGMAALCAGGALLGWLGVARTVVAVRQFRALRTDEAGGYEPSIGGDRPPG